MGINKIKKEKEISLETSFSLPEKISYINYDGRIIAIAVDMANWIMLNNDTEKRFFELLHQHHTIQNSILLANPTEEEISNVLTQIVAKDFLNQVTVSKTPDSFLQIYLTNACNMKCPHCYMYAGTKYDNELSFSEIENLLKVFSRHHGKSVIFTGGEISLRKDLKDILSAAKSQGLRVEVLTNGISWSSEMYDWAAPLIDQVQVSVDGYDENENSKIRGAGNFSKAISCVEEFTSRGVQTRVAITPRYHNTLHTKISKYCDFAKELIRKYGKSFIGCSFSGELMEGRQIKLNESQQEYYKSCIESIESELYGVHKYQSFIDSIKNHIIADNCAFGQLSIASDGNVFLCPKVSNLKSIGNIRNLNLDALFSLSDIASVKSHVDNLKPCSDCELKFICGGGCRIKFFSFMKEGLIPSQGSFAERECSKEYKESFYRLMVELDEYIYQ